MILDENDGGNCIWTPKSAHHDFGPVNAPDNGLPKEHATIFKENVDNMEILPEIQIQQATNSILRWIKNLIY
jgi:hypothetical protein